MGFHLDQRSKTPYELVFGKLVREMRTQGRENLISDKEKSKIYYDKKLNPLEEKMGDNVFLLTEVKLKNLTNIIQDFMKYWKC